jgi:hypothetical protein
MEILTLGLSFCMFSAWLVLIFLKVWTRLIFSLYKIKHVKLYCIYSQRIIFFLILYRIYLTLPSIFGLFHGKESRFACIRQFYFCVGQWVNDTYILCYVKIIMLETLKMEATCSSKKLVPTYQNILVSRNYNSKGHNMKPRVNKINKIWLSHNKLMLCPCEEYEIGRIPCSVSLQKDCQSPKADLVIFLVITDFIVTSHQHLMENTDSCNLYHLSL